MNFCDSNIWLALALSGHGHHQAACHWLGGVTEPASIVFCRATQQSFLRLLTNQTVLGAFGNPPLTNRQAWAVYDALLEDDRILLRVDEPPGLDSFWKKFVVRDSASPKLWMDGYLAAFAVTAGYQMVTNDHAYRQFLGLDLLLVD